MHIRHDIESCEHGGEDQDKTWLDGPVASVKGKLEAFGAMDRVAVKLEQDLAPMDEGNGEKQVRSRSMNQQGHVMI